jgi:hypothetical protein
MDSKLCIDALLDTNRAPARRETSSGKLILLSAISHASPPSAICEGFALTIAQMKKLTSSISYDYITLRTTQSRIDKGVLAIPVSLIHLFPEKTERLFLVDEKGTEASKSFTPLSGSSGECRISGLKTFYSKNNIRDGDEIVIQLLEGGRFRLVPERIFERSVLELEKQIESSETHAETSQLLKRLSEMTNKTAREVASSEFVRLSSTVAKKRRTRNVRMPRTRESVPSSLRRILLELYSGKCQVSGFTFSTKSGAPYFETHHINPEAGNHVKNVLVVSPNVHAQFTHASVEHMFDEEGWLREVRFNARYYPVFQIIDSLQRTFEKEVH